MRIFWCIGNYFQERTLLKNLIRRRKKNLQRNWKELITSVKIKCYEKKGCICERNEHFTSDCSRNALYSELHQKAREYYNIPESSETYLAKFYDKKIEAGSKDLGTYALAQKEKKREFNYIYYIQLYLLYSNLLPSIFVEVRTASNQKRLRWWRTVYGFWWNWVYFQWGKMVCFFRNTFVLLQLHSCEP